MYKCYICLDKGSIIARLPKKIGNQTYEYCYSLHCDCEAGQRTRIDYRPEGSNSRWYEEPISQYFDTKELERVNRQKYEKIENKQKFEKKAV